MSSPLFDFTGRVALITGAGRGVGEAIARRFVQQGAAVIINDLNATRVETVVDSIRSSGGKATGAIADVTDTEELARAISEAVDQLGPVDILVNNAGLPAEGLQLRPFLESDRGEWGIHISLSLVGVLTCTGLVLEPMLQREWGRILTITSDAGRFGEAQMSVYAAAKAASMGFARSLAKEVGPSGVTCNSLSLGSLQPPGDNNGRDTERRARRYPMCRLGHPDDAAAAAVWLCSEEAGWVTGQTISVNGGYSTT